jgi:Na+-driven multidrug efflux pump
MFVLTLLCEIAPAGMIRFFNSDPAVVGFGSEYLRIVCWNFLASGVVFVSSSVFQGMGNTLPPLAASALRLLFFALPAYAISHQTGFQLRQLWYLSVASVTIQLLVNLWLLHREFARKLAPLGTRGPASGGGDIGRPSEDSFRNEPGYEEARRVEGRLRPARWRRGSG